MAAESATVGQTEPLRAPTPEFEQDTRAASWAPEYLARGQALLGWWREMERNGGPADRFPPGTEFQPADPQLRLLWRRTGWRCSCSLLWATFRRCSTISSARPRP